MKNHTEFLKRFKELVEYGTDRYLNRIYNESNEDIQRRMDSTNFTFSITTSETPQTFNFVTRDEVFVVPLDEVKDEVVDVLWYEFGNCPINEDDETEYRFLHFEDFTDRVEVWHWFEWFFDITIGERFSK